MAAPVARQEAQRQPAELGEEDVVRRLAPGALDAPPLGALQPRQVVEARSADDAENRIHRDAPETFSDERLAVAVQPTKRAGPRSRLARDRRPDLLLGVVDEAGEDDEEDHNRQPHRLAVDHVRLGRPHQEGRHVLRILVDRLGNIVRLVLVLVLRIGRPARRRAAAAWREPAPQMKYGL